MKVLITGSTGLVGSEAVQFFTEKGWEVFGVDNNMRSQLFGTPRKIPQFNLDIRDQVSVFKMFATYKFDAIIHAAAQPSHDWAKKEPLTDFDINARATLILLEATRLFCPEAVFVYVSTDKVYGENMRTELVELPLRYEAEKPFDESLGLDFAGKRSLFGCSKASADMYVQEYGNYYGMKTACFRPGCITGKNHEGAEYHGFLAYLAKCIKEGKTYKIFGYKGKQVRDQIHARDLVNAFYHFIHKPRLVEVYNIGGGPERSVSILEAGEMMSKKLDKPFLYELIEEPRRGDRQWDVHDVSKFKNHYPDWNYQFSLEAIIDDVCAK